MAVEIVVPPVGESITSVTLLQWLKHAGDAVRTGDLLAEIETDKATMPIESPADGVLLESLVAEGETVEVGRLIAVVGAPGERWAGTRRRGGSDTDDGPDETSLHGSSSGKVDVDPAAASAAVGAGGGVVRSAPSARELAGRLGIDIAEVAKAVGGKRVTEAHVREFAGRRKENKAGVAVVGGGRVVTLSRTRLAVARKMEESAQTVPQFSVSVRIDATALLSAKHRRTGARNPTTVTAFLVQACCRALQAHPQVNSRYLGDGRVLLFDRHNIAVAVSSDEGLVAPVIHDVDRLSIEEIADQLAALVKRVRSRTYTASDLEGPTFTVSNLGSAGVWQFTPIVVPGQSAILGVASIEQILVMTGGEVQTRPVLTATLAADHRVLDGAGAVAFLNSMKELLETRKQESH